MNLGRPNIPNHILHNHKCMIDINIITNKWYIDLHQKYGQRKGLRVSFFGLTWLPKLFMFKVAFSLLANINQSACSALDGVLNSSSDFDWVLYKHHLGIPIHKKTIPKLTCLPIVPRPIIHEWVTSEDNIAITKYNLYVWHLLWLLVTLYTRHSIKFCVITVSVYMLVTQKYTCD